MKTKDMNLNKYETFSRNPTMQNYSFYPIRVCLYLTRACNLSCPSCTYSGNEYFRKASFLGTDQFQQIRDATKGYAVSYAMAGGEPLLNKDAFKFVAMANGVEACTTTINTNGILLGKYIDDVLESKLSRMQISFDAIDDAGYQRERGGKPGDFAKLCNNVRELLRERDKRKSPFVAISFLLHKENFKELGDMIAFAEDLGVDQVGFHNLNNHMNDSFEPLMRQDAEVTDYLNRVMRRKYNISILLPALIEKKFSICPMPFKDIYINDEMEVNPCCHVMDFSYSKFSADIMECWKTDRLNRFRMSFLEGKLPHANCRNCHRRFSFYGTYDISTGWLKDNWHTRQLRKIVRSSPGIYRFLNKVRNNLNRSLKKN